MVEKRLFMSPSRVNSIVQQSYKKMASRQRSQRRKSLVRVKAVNHMVIGQAGMDRALSARSLVGRSVGPQHFTFSTFFIFLRLFGPTAPSQILWPQIWPLPTRTRLSSLVSGLVNSALTIQKLVKEALSIRPSICSSVALSAMHDSTNVKTRLDPSISIVCYCPPDDSLTPGYLFLYMTLFDILIVIRCCV